MFRVETTPITGRCLRSGSRFLFAQHRRRTFVGVGHESSILFTCAPDRASKERSVFFFLSLSRNEKEMPSASSIENIKTHTAGCHLFPATPTCTCRRTAPTQETSLHPHRLSPMADARKTRKPTKRSHRGRPRPQKQPEKPSSWKTLGVLFSCKDHACQPEETKKRGRRSGCSVSLCSIKETSAVLVRPKTPPDPCRKRASTGGCGSAKVPPNGTDSGPLSSSFPPRRHPTRPVTPPPLSAAAADSPGGLRLRRFSGCYECHAVMDQINGCPRNPSLRSTIRSCSACGEMFTKSENLELHQAVKHAVSELGPGDTSRNVVEIIFQSSWLKRQAPACRIDRILKVNNTRKTIDRFEDYRDAVRCRAAKLSRKYPRCMADGNELLRFHCTTVTCSVGLNGSTGLCCKSTPRCSLCAILRDGFEADVSGTIQTMATSGRAHDVARVSPEQDRRAMLVCRVIAGRVKRSFDSTDDYDSVCSPTGLYSNLDKLFVFSPRAILPCFVVIYRTS